MTGKISEDPYPTAATGYTFPAVQSGVNVQVPQARTDVSVHAYGAKGDGSSDDTTAIQLAIDTLSAAGGGIVSFRAARYRATKIVLKPGVSLQGSGIATELMPLASAETGFLQMGSGRIRNAHVRGFHFMGGTAFNSPVNSGQWAMYFVAAVGAQSDGGMWQSLFAENLIDMWDNGAWWRAGRNSTLPLPHQFITFQANEIDVNWGGTALRGTGNCNQFAILDDRIGGVYSTGKAHGGTGLSIGKDPTGSFSDDIAPSHWTMLQGAIEHIGQGAVIDNGFDISLQDVWHEELQKGIQAKNAAYNIRANGGHYANVENSGSGYLFRVETQSYFQADGVFVRGTYDKIYTTDSGQGRCDVRNVTLALNADTSQAYTSALTTGGIVGASINGSGAIDIFGMNTVAVNTSATSLVSINGKAMPGDILTIQAAGGTVTVATGGNLYLGINRAAITLDQNETMTFKRSDNFTTERWMLMGRSSIIPDASPGDSEHWLKKRLVIHQQLTGDNPASINLDAFDSSHPSQVLFSEAGHLSWLLQKDGSQNFAFIAVDEGTGAGLGTDLALVKASGRVQIGRNGGSGTRVQLFTTLQTTVGAAGAASALPATPTKYMRVLGDDGTEYLIPCYTAT